MEGRREIRGGKATASESGELFTHKGGCHCGAVQFEIKAPDSFDVEDCTKKGFLHLIVPKTRFTLQEGSEAALTCYTFNTGVAKHLYVPRSNPDGYSVNVRCLELQNVHRITVVPFDGQNWEANGAALADKSKET